MTRNQAIQITASAMNATTLESDAPARLVDALEALNIISLNTDVQRFSQQATLGDSEHTRKDFATYRTRS